MGCFGAIKKICITVLVIVLIVLAVPFGINGWVCLSTKGQIQSSSKVISSMGSGSSASASSESSSSSASSDANASSGTTAGSSSGTATSSGAASTSAEAIAVLGAGINNDGSPSSILQDRLDVAIQLYEGGVAPKIIMTGDNSTSSYNEVMAMANYAIAQGVPRDDIFCDHAGVSTYDSMYRLRHVFGVTKCVIVTQEYHLYRALYNASSFGIDAAGVNSDLRTYTDINSYEQREFFARIKDFFQCMFNVEPDLKSEPVSLNQSGTVTQWWK